uniref:LSM2 homolog, U6 small nuclear RNA and mRNA degradation associated n=1 Tax=Pundamilia nyererei TaxID=303518 RepID=A0A3B4GQZ5_9CICH
MLFYSFFKSLVGKDVVVELKNDLSICGTLHSVDQYLNIKLTDISVTDPEKYPHMVSFASGDFPHFIQGEKRLQKQMRLSLLNRSLRFYSVQKKRLLQCTYKVFKVLLQRSVQPVKETTFSAAVCENVEMLPFYLMNLLIR